jgi:hypothetical protein
MESRGPEQVPAVFGQMADRLERVAAAVRDYMNVKHKQWPDSVAAREEVQEREFTALPFTHPMAALRLSPMPYLGSSQDHLVAIAAAVRAPHTAIAWLTLLRTQLVGAATAAYLLDRVDVRERMRRYLNLELRSLTEEPSLVAGDQAEVTRIDDRRQRIKRGARALGWTVAGNDTKLGRPPQLWKIEPALNEMQLLDWLLRDMTDPTDHSVRTQYRFLSAMTHVQTHGFASLLNREVTVFHGDGTASAAVAMDGRMLVTMAFSAVTALTMAIDRGITYYGWSPAVWQAKVIPLVAELRAELGVTAAPRGVQLLG